MFGLQLGFRYGAGAFVADGRKAPPCENPVRDLVPGLRSGSRLPHAWVVHDGRRVSILDLIAGNRPTLIVGSSATSWLNAAEACDSPKVEFLMEGRDFTDDEGHWATVREIDATGAVLVRPDQHVAWYALGALDDAATRLQAAIGALSGYGARDETRTPAGGSPAGVSVFSGTLARS